MPKKAARALAPDLSCVREFLFNVVDRDWFHLLAGNPNTKSKIGGMRGHIAADVDAALEWIEAQQARGFNIYWPINLPSNVLVRKADRSDLKWIQHLQLDLDMPKDIRPGERAAWLDAALERVHNCERIRGRPSSWISGNGVQAVWRLAKPLKATADHITLVERLNKQLIAEFGASPGTHDAPRIFRVAGTVNFPGAAKIARGWKPVMSEMHYASRDEFALEDFDALPPARSAVALNSQSYIDFTRTHRYSAGYSAWRWADVAAEEPELVATVAKSLDGSQHDRSAALWSFLHSLADFIQRKERCDAAHLCEDKDTYRNIMEIVLEAGETEDVIDEVLEHVFAHPKQLAKLGYDVQRVIDQQADEGRGATARGISKTETRRSVAAINAKPADDVTAGEARKAFMDYVHSCTNVAELPNAAWSGGDKLANRQHSTESNVRAVLHNAGIVARWDVMADQPRYMVLEDAGSSSRDAGAPLRNWLKATASSHADNRSAVEESLLLDCFSAYNITARSELAGLMNLIAEEKRFHPLEDYCRARPWDGIPRIRDVAACLTSTHPLKERYIQLFFRQCIAAVRSLQTYMATGDGEQMSSCVVLIGHQGLLKSTFWKRITPQGMLSKGTTLRLGTVKEADSKREVLSGLVAVLDEIGASLDRSQADDLKNFMAATFDEFRVAFARRPISKARMTVFCGTSNALHLSDQTGSRRFLALPITEIDLARLADIDLQQCYAEAWAAVMERGATWWLAPDEDAIRAVHNDEHRVMSEDESMLRDYLAHTTPQHEFCWLSSTQICRALGLRFSPARWPAMKAVLDASGIKYSPDVRWRGLRLRRVYGFPVLPEVYRAITA